MILPTNSRTADKFVVRLPEGMRQLITEVAKGNNRSMNSEIISYIERTLILDKEGGTAPWTPVIGMLVVYENDIAQTKPMEILSFERDSEFRTYFNVKMVLEGSTTTIFANQCRPYFVK